MTRRLAAHAGLCLGATVLAVAVFILMFGGAILNGYGKRKVERAFAAAHPGSELRIGELDYAAGANRLVAEAVTLRAANTTLKVSRVSLTGVHWVQLWWGPAALADVLSQAALDATDLEAEFPQAHYRIRCARLRASVPGSDLIAEGTELWPSVGDEEFFAAHDFRTRRIRVVVPECRVEGLAFGEILQGRSYQARSIEIFHPTFEALINRDKPPQPFVTSPLMVHEVLAAIRQPLQIGRLSVTDGLFRYCERLAVGADPAVLTVGAVSLSIAGIANRGKATAAIELRAQGDLMKAGKMKLLMTIPIEPPDFSLHYSGSLGVMDLTRLDAFLEIAEHTRIKSGRVQEATFEIDVTAGQARGRVEAVYENLEFAMLGQATGSEKRLDHRVASFLANGLKFRSSNPAGVSGTRKEGKVDFTRRPDDEFQQFVWFALRSGALDVVSQ